MRAICDDVACLQHMLDFEAALARAEAAAGVIPAGAAGPIAAACQAAAFDLGALAEAATRSGNLAIPLVKALTAEVAKTDPEAARYVHWGATSQDVIDTAAMLTLRAGIDALLADLDRAIAGFAKLAAQHRTHRDGGAHLAAACAADAVRTQTGGICRGTASLAHAVAAIAQRSAGAAVRRRRRHAGRARRQRMAGGGKTGRGARSAAAGCALAHPSRPHRGGGLGAGDPCRHLRQDRPRRPADDADRRRRGVRAVGRRPRRLLDHAAQAQSGRGRDRAGRGHHGAESGGDDFRRAGAGARTQRRALARGMADIAEPCCSSPRARSPPSSISPKGWRSMRRGCAPISTPPTG